MKAIRRGLTCTEPVPDAIRLARATFKTIRRNLARASGGRVTVTGVSGGKIGTGTLTYNANPGVGGGRPQEDDGKGWAYPVFFPGLR